jgi:glyoxylase-like metal-dependent hydrolase (beta-lactamase superfamily II)
LKSACEFFGGWPCAPLDFGRLHIERLENENRLPRILLPVTACLICLEKRLVLIDAGFDPGLEGRVERVKWHRPELSIEEQLRDYQLGADDVTDVVLTHLHDDHASGLLDRASGLSLYPNALFHLQDVALFKGFERVAMGGERFVSGELLEFLSDSDRTRTYHGDWRLDELQILHTGGHTPGHQIVYAGKETLQRGSKGKIEIAVQAQSETQAATPLEGLFFAGDLVSMRACLDPTFRTSSDVDPETATLRRQELARLGKHFFLYHAQNATRFYRHEMT